jgi:hypothetical protein
MTIIWSPKFSGAQILERVSYGEPRRNLHLFRAHPKGHFIKHICVCEWQIGDIHNIFVRPRLRLKFANNSCLWPCARMMHPVQLWRHRRTRNPQTSEGGKYLRESCKPNKTNALLPFPGRRLGHHRACYRVNF